MKIVEGFEVTVLQDDDSITYAEVTVRVGRGAPYVIGRGVARRRPGDTRDSGLGELIAVARAFKAAHASTLRELDARGYGDIDA